MGCEQVSTSSDISGGGGVAAALVCAATNRAAVCFARVTFTTGSEGRNEHLAGVLSPTWGRC